MKKKDGVETPRSFTDYAVTIDRAAIPEGVEVIKNLIAEEQKPRKQIGFHAV